MLHFKTKITAGSLLPRCLWNCLVFCADFTQRLAGFRLFRFCFFIISAALALAIFSQPLLRVEASAYPTIYDAGLSGYNWQAWGRNSYTPNDIGQSFTPAQGEWICGVGLYTEYGFGAPAIYLSAELRSGGTNPTNGVLMETATSDNVVSSTPQYITFSFPACASVATSTTYFFHFSSSAPSDSDYPQSAYVAGSGYYSNSYGWNYSGSHQWAIQIYGLAGFNLGESFYTSSTLPAATIDCSGGNWLSNSFCSVLAYLFVPSPSSFNQFFGLFDSIKNKPPVGYFYAVQSAMAELSSSSTPAVAVSIYPDFITSIFSPVRTGLIIVLWIFLAFWIFHRIKSLNL